MYADSLEQAVRAEIEPIMTALGYALVELSVGRRTGVTNLVIVVHRSEGVGVEQCAEVSRAILPRLALVEGLENPALEVSSPGIERTFKSPAEYGIFTGRGLQVLPAEGGEWIGGVIMGWRDGILALATPGGMREFPEGSIRRARLDYRLDPPEARAAGKRSNDSGERSHAV